MPQRPLSARLLRLFACAFLAACGGGGGDPTAPPPTPPAAVAAIRITPASPSLVTGATVQLTATPLDAAGTTLTGRTVSWNSEMSSIATVSASGLVTGVSPGSARIQATSGGVTGDVTVTVTPAPVASVLITPSAPSVESGDTLRLAAAARDAQGNALPGRTIQWTSLSPAIASVSASGLVTALAPGSTTVRATAESVSQEVTLTVRAAAVATVRLSRDTATLVPGQPLVLATTLLDARGNTLGNRVVTWTSSVEGVASVASNGAVTAIAPGTTTITATSETKSATATITVTAGGWIGVNGGTVTGGSGAVSLTVGANALTAFAALTVTPLGAPPAAPRLLVGTAYTFGPETASFAQPVTVRVIYPAASLGNANAGNLRLHRYTNGAWVPVPGSTVNTMTRAVTGATTSLGRYAVLELPPVASVSLSTLTDPLAVGETTTLVATLRDESGATVTERGITWTSSNVAVVQVSATGQLTAVAVGGPITITATSEGKSATTTVSVTAQFRLRDIGTGEDHSCALDLEGAAWCWGDGEDGRLGTGIEDVRATHIPVRVSTSQRFTSIAVGGEFTCALTSAGAAYCWGVNTWSALGDGTDDDRYRPTLVVGGHAFVQLSAGNYHTCGLLANGEARCWGANFDGAIGDGTGTERQVPTLVSGGHSFTTIASGDAFTCALNTEGEAWCWGRNVYGQLGDSTTRSRAAPVRVLGGHRFAGIAAGGWHTCAIKQNGEAWCWGNGRFGSVGDGAWVERRMPVRVAGSFQFTSIIAGEDHSCGLLITGRAACWGYNVGSVGDGTTIDRNSPVLVSGNRVYSKLAASYAETTCALTPAGVGYCWGDNDYGEGNHEDFDYVLEPLRVVDPTMANVTAASRIVSPGARGWRTEKPKPRKPSGGGAP